MSTCDYCDQPATGEWDHHDVTVTTCGDCHPDDEGDWQPMGTCDYCAEPDDPRNVCQEPTYGYVCTRAPGHDGPHVACGTTDHQIVIWRN